MFLRWFLLLAIIATFSADASAQIFRRTPRRTTSYYEMGCNCANCVANRGGTYAQVYAKQTKNPSAPSPPEVVALALHLADLKPTDLLYDVGSGDGRVIEAAVRDYGCQAVGIEHSSAIASSSRGRLSASQKLPRRWRIVEGDATKYDLSKATVAYMNLYPETLEKVVPRLKGCTRMISFRHPIPGYQNKRYETEHGPIYIVGWRQIHAVAANGVAAAVIKKTVSKSASSVRVCRT